jgi:hypothetical protein
MCDYFTKPTPTDDEVLASLMGVAQVFFNWYGAPPGDLRVLAWVR